MSMSGEEIKVLLTADAAQLQDGMAQGAASVQSSADAMQASIAQEAAAFNASVQSKIDAQVRLNAAFAGGITSAAQIAEAESALDQAMAAGAVTANEYSGYVGQLDAAEAAMAGATQAATVAVEENTAAMVINGGVARELGVLTGELARGNIHRLEGSMITLANRTGLLQKALQFVVSPVGLAAEAVAAMGVAAIAADDHFGKLEQTIASTGGIVGLSAGDLQHMADDVGLMTGHTFEAVDALDALGRSGRFTGDQLQVAAEAAVNFSTVTGENVKQASRIIEEMQEKPAKAIAAVNDQFHFLTASQADLIAQLLKTGDGARAASVAISAFNTAMMNRKDEMEAHQSAIARGWHDISNWAQQAAEHAAEYIEVQNGGGDVTEKLAVAQRQLNQDQQIATHWWSDRWGLMTGISAKEITQEKAVVDQLEAQKKAEDALLASKTKTAEQVAKSFDAATGAGKKGGANHEDHDAAQADRDAYNEQRLQHNLSLADEKKFWEEKLAAAKHGTQEYRQAVDQLLQLKQKEATAGKEAAREEESANHKAAASAMSALDMERAGTAANTAARIQADAAILASATKLYGAESSQQKAALTRMLADEKAYDAAVTEARKKATAANNALISQALDNAKDAAQAELAVKKEALQTEVDVGKISKQQEIAALQAAETQEYQIELAALQQRLALLNLEAPAQAKINAQIEKLQQTHQLAMQKATDDQQKEWQKSWQNALKPIDNAFNQSIKGMIQGTQTFKKGLDNMLQSIVESYAQMGLRTVMNWIANEGAKTSATATGTASRNTIEQAGAVQSKAIDADTSKSGITNAAATGAAKAYQAIVGIPYVGPILAPIAAGVAFIGIEAFAGSIASAEGGWDRVPFDGAMTQLHKNEMVLPAHLAEGVRNMTAQGGGKGAGGNTINVHANDARSFKDMLRRNPAALADALKYAGRRGHFAGAR